MIAPLPRCFCSGRSPDRANGPIASLPAPTCNLEEGTGLSENPLPTGTSMATCSTAPVVKESGKPRIKHGLNTDKTGDEEICLLPFPDSSDSFDSWFFRHSSDFIVPFASILSVQIRFVRGPILPMIDMIRAYVAKAQAGGATIRFDVWDEMNHDFQALGDRMPQSKEALERIGEFAQAAISQPPERAKSS